MSEESMADARVVRKRSDEIRAVLKLCESDGRRRISKEHEAIRKELLADFGGQQRCSAAQMLLIETIAREALLLFMTDSYIANLGLLFDKRRRRVHGIIHDRNRIASVMAEHLKALGVKRGRLAGLVK
jgi:hypothetical protein